MLNPIDLDSNQYVDDPYCLVGQQVEVKAISFVILSWGHEYFTYTHILVYRALGIVS